MIHCIIVMYLNQYLIKKTISLNKMINHDRANNHYKIQKINMCKIFKKPNVQLLESDVANWGDIIISCTIIEGQCYLRLHKQLRTKTKSSSNYTEYKDLNTVGWTTLMTLRDNKNNLHNIPSSNEPGTKEQIQSPLIQSDNRRARQSNTRYVLICTIINIEEIENRGGGYRAKISRTEQTP